MSTPSIMGDVSFASTVTEPDSSIVGARLYAAVSNNNQEVVIECVKSASAAEVNWINKDEVRFFSLFSSSYFNVCVLNFVLLYIRVRERR